MHSIRASVILATYFSGLLTASSSRADGPAAFTVTRTTMYSWFWCSHCDPIRVDPNFSARLGSDGAYTTERDCAGAGPIFSAEWNSNSVCLRTLVDTRQRCWDCLGSYTCGGCGWGLMGPMWDGFSFHGNAPFFLPMFSEYTPEGAFQTEPMLEHQEGWSGMPDGYVFRFTACREDLDASGEVDFADISMMLLNFGSAPGGNWYPRLDLDGSEFVDNGDLAIQLMSAGPCPW